MFTNRIVAVFALLFAAALLAHPGPAIAQSDVDKAMDVLPSPGSMGKGVSPGAAQGIIVVDSKPGDNQPPPDDNLPSPGGGGKVVSPGAAQGIIIVNSKPGGGSKVVSPGAAKGIILQSPSPAAHGAPAMKNIKALQ